jgi:N-acetylmuramoyl-L-alanine amidase
MMHISLNLRLAALATLALAALGQATPAIAQSMFGQQEIDSSRFVAVASPYGGNAHQLLIIKQLSNVRSCWSESGTSPTVINPLLVEFDFTDICGRSTDSNGYSMRVGGEDQNWRYSFRVVKRDGDLQLIAAPNIDRTLPELLIARTRGYTSGFAKFYFEPGWRLTERSYQGASVGHVYLTNDQSIASLNATAIAARPVFTPVFTRPVATTPGYPSSPVFTNPGSNNLVIPPTSVAPISVAPTPVAPISVPSVQVPRPVTQPQPNKVQKRRSSWFQQLFGR